MRSLLRPTLAVLTVVIGTVTYLSSASPVSAQTAATPTPPTISAKAGTNGDYLVTVNKHVMWKSQVETMHPTLANKAVPLSKANHTDFPVTVGKQTVMASTVRRSSDTQTRPAAHDKACKDYLVQIGKQNIWASSANCPMGKHENGAKPLCCAVPLIEEGKPLPLCCKDAPKSH